MILVDTSVWIQHLRRGDARLAALLEQSLVACHPFVIGELAMGSIKRRDEFLTLMHTLPQLPVTPPADVMQLVNRQQLHGRGLGWVDANLLASALLGHAQLWTLDERLAEAAAAVGLKSAGTGRPRRV